MSTFSNWLQKHLHLLISIIIVVPTAFIYGFGNLNNYLNIQATTTDLASMLKATMMLYLFSAFIWCLGIYTPKFWRKATELNILFMLALGFGRCISIVVDGLPSNGYLFGLIGELILGFYSVYQWRTYN